MPFLIGVHANMMDVSATFLTITAPEATFEHWLTTLDWLQLVRKQDLGDAVILDADANTVTTEYDDLATLPKEVVRNQTLSTSALCSASSHVSFKNVRLLNITSMRTTMLCSRVVFFFFQFNITFVFVVQRRQLASDLEEASTFEVLTTCCL